MNNGQNNQQDDSAKRNHNAPESSHADAQKTTKVDLDSEGTRGNRDDIREEKDARHDGDDIIGQDS